MNLTEQFESAVSKSKTMTRKPSNEELLSLYGLFKQATEGDNPEPRPGGFDFKAIAKHDAWTEQKGLSKDDAMQKYVTLVDQLVEIYK